jgi:hypothetical protein
MPTVIIVYFRRWGDGEPLTRVLHYTEEHNAMYRFLTDGDYVQFF